MNHIVASEELVAKGISIIDKIGTKGPLAIKGVIECANAFFDKEKEGFDFEARTFGNLFTSSDVIEGTTAFIEKRKAAFQGK